MIWYLKKTNKSSLWSCWNPWVSREREKAEAFFLCMCERVGFGASASSIFYVRMLKWKGTRGGSFLGLLHPWVRGRWRAFSIFFFFVFLLQLSEEERITRVGWVLLNVWPAGLVGVVFFLFLFLFSTSWLFFLYLTRLKFRLSL